MGSINSKKMEEREAAASVQPIRNMDKPEPVISVHPFTNDPTDVWCELSKTQIFTQLPVCNKIKKTLQPGYVRVVCMSDTHSEQNNFKFEIPQGDIFIHAGDFTRWGVKKEVVEFNEWMKSLPHRHKIVIAGNHEMSFDAGCDVYGIYNGENFIPNIRTLLTDCTYLEDTSVTLYGLKIYGSPWQPEHGGFAFNLKRGQELLNVWNQIPQDTDILITHGPPLGHGDKLDTGCRAGCVELLSTVQKRVKPKYHIFGHIHEGYGMSTDEATVFINAATCNRYYFPKNLPIVFDIKINDQT